MNAIVLAAGYGTRAGELGERMPKAFFPVGGTPLGRLMDEFQDIGEIERVYIVINNNPVYNPQFHKWLECYNGLKPVTLIEDGSTANENKLGAIRDLQFVLNHPSWADDDVLVVPSDRLFTERNMDDFCAYFRKKGTIVNMCEDVVDPELTKKGSCLDFYPDSFRCSGITEKPENPTSSWYGLAFYIFPKGTLHMIRMHEQMENQESPGWLLQWLRHERGQEVNSFLRRGECYDLGCPADYEKALEIFGD